MNHTRELRAARWLEPLAQETSRTARSKVKRRPPRKHASLLLELTLMLVLALLLPRPRRRE